MDKVAVANFISETAFAYSYDVAGALIAFVTVLMVLILFRDRLLDIGSFIRVRVRF